MGNGPSLLRRIQRQELANPGSRVNLQEVRDSILAHLRTMCLTREGTMLTRPDYGIACVSEMVHNFPDAIAIMARSIRHTIETYEPRLTNVRVRHVPGPDLILRFEISAQLTGNRSNPSLQFETTIDTTRAIGVH
ncbi:MAG: type VI secretion system baseplate subunit TssE [Polyangiaceae bacterium]|nr:type VI secretion system baseplate subunit TssE [Polyangiaceae bacterium]